MEAGSVGRHHAGVLRGRASRVVPVLSFAPVLQAADLIVCLSQGWKLFGKRREEHLIRLLTSLVTC